MAISLQDAVERMKLMNDNDGHVSQYFYNQILSSLDPTDQHAFAMALVDNGVKVKTGLERAGEALESTKGADPQSGQGSFSGKEIYALLKRRAQQFVQSPGGLWLPSDYVNQPEEPKQPFEYQEPENPEELMKNVEDFGDEDGTDYLSKRKRWLTPEQSEKQLIDESTSDFLDVDTMSHVQDVLSENGIYVDSKGMVTNYKSKNRPMPLEQAVRYYQDLSTSMDSEQSKVNELQDILTRFKNDTDALNKYKYSIKSRNPMISDLGKGVDELKKRMEGISDFTNGMVSMLDQYYQTQYDNYASYMEVYDALWNLNEWKKIDPQKFKTVIQGIGAI